MASLVSLVEKGDLLNTIKTKPMCAQALSPPSLVGEEQQALFFGWTFTGTTVVVKYEIFPIKKALLTTWSKCNALEPTFLFQDT